MPFRNFVRHAAAAALLGASVFGYGAQPFDKELSSLNKTAVAAHQTIPQSHADVVQNRKLRDRFVRVLLDYADLYGTRDATLTRAEYADAYKTLDNFATVVFNQYTKTKVRYELTQADMATIRHAIEIARKDFARAQEYLKKRTDSTNYESSQLSSDDRARRIKAGTELVATFAGAHNSCCDVFWFMAGVRDDKGNIVPIDFHF